MTKNIFRLSILLILTSAVFVILTPVISINNFIYPIRVDSTFVLQQQIRFEKNPENQQEDSSHIFIYGPDQLDLHYKDILLSMSDSIVLRGWMALDTTHKQSPLLLIIPDMKEGAISYLPAMKQFCDRGFNVCVINLRGQGNSDGDIYNPGQRSVEDVYNIVNQLKKMPFISRVAIMGIGTGAGIALKAIADSTIADVGIFQNLSPGLKRYLYNKLVSKWGVIIKPFFPVVMRSYEQSTGIKLANHNYIQIIKTLYTPHLLVTANFNSKNDIDETVQVYNASGYYKKRLYIDADTYLKPPGFSNNKKYYDKISTFINSSLPSNKKRTRFGKLAFDSNNSFKY